MPTWNLIYSDDFTDDQTTFAAKYSNVSASCLIGPTNGPDGGPGVLTASTTPSFKLPSQTEIPFESGTVFIPGPQTSAFRITGIWKLRADSLQSIFVFNGDNYGNSIFVLWANPAGRGTAEIQTSPIGFMVLQDPLQTLTLLAFDIQGKLSTLTAGAPNSDGWLTVLINSVEVLSLTNVELWYGVDTPNGWGSLGIRPSGNFGSLRIYNEATVIPPPTSPAPTFVNSVPCCCKDCEESRKAGDSILGATPAFVGPDWTSACAGGGTVPSAADLTASETWDY